MVMEVEERTSDMDAKIGSLVCLWARESFLVGDGFFPFLAGSSIPFLSTGNTLNNASLFI